MSVIDLKKRHTFDWDEMHKHLSSPDSMVYLGNTRKDVSCPTSIDLNVGSVYIIPGSNQTYAIPDEGLKIKPHRSVVVYTEQRMKLPYNVFGVVTGKGTFIFKGCFLSTGKIDPAFDGYLKIGFYNGGNSSVVLKKGEPFATVFFLNTDATLKAPLREYQTNLAPDVPRITWYQRCWIYTKEHWLSFLAWAIVALPAAIDYIMRILNNN